MYRPISNYAIIGNLRSAVLISKDASIDWAPAPFIDSPSIFASLLDDKNGGFWSIRPRDEYIATQKYIDETNILVTTFGTKTGTIEVTDFIPIDQEKAYVPDAEDTTFRIHRKIECTKGVVDVRIVFVPRFDYARGTTHLSYQTGGISIKNHKMHGTLSAEHVGFSIEEGRAVASTVISEGESEYLIFRYNAGEIVLRKDEKHHHEAELEETVTFWRNWVHRCDDPLCPAEGKYGDMIKRSELLLKILFFEPVGTVAAAATTSLPEEKGGVRNWDYRFTWIRDSSFLFESFLKLGHTNEAEQYLTWLISKCFGNDPDNDNFAPMQIMYPLRDETSLEEEILPHLEGYENSRPVRIGNDAYRQKQWDIYGNILDLIWKLYEVKNDPPPPRLWKLVHSLATYILGVWRLPDEGLWEVRGGKQHFTYSKVMCWAALDRAIRLAEKYGYTKAVDIWKKEKDIIADEVWQRSWNDEIGSFVQSYDSKNLDAALLLLPSTGFIKGNDPKMRSTIEAIKNGLKKDSIYLKRYTSYDGLPGNEGAFLLASFWLVDALILAGERDEATRIFEGMLARANNVGLYAEEIDPETGEFLGNFPQAYTHLGLIMTAFNLSDLDEKLRRREHADAIGVIASTNFSPVEQVSAELRQDVP